ncbi:hypothetical protein CES85_3924 [Ochrobactrum quorumnocens]|uniref:Uncharacterized protein n=1 Tax=Ochrobactrum quorumnocens TaxID=271865 RepID=A0A248U8X3_9HYPH|nr:hypothetical protein CES85_3924 [[Ochrobactrum] quorumnocens]
MRFHTQLECIPKSAKRFSDKMRVIANRQSACLIASDGKAL